nr:cell division cycle 48C [Tanacetum cinerariifolium]
RDKPGFEKMVNRTLDFITSTTNISIKFELDELKRRLRVLASLDSSVSESKTESDEEKNVSVVLSLGENEEPKLDLSKKMLRGKYLKLTKNVGCEVVNNSDRRIRPLNQVL